MVVTLKNKHLAIHVHNSLKAENLLVYTIEWKWNLHLGRLKIFWFFLDQIVRNFSWRLGYYILIKEGNCGKNSTKLVMSHRHLKNEIYPMERDFLIN